MFLTVPNQRLQNKSTYRQFDPRRTLTENFLVAEVTSSGGTSPMLFGVRSFARRVVDGSTSFFLVLRFLLKFGEFFKLKKKQIPKL